MLRATTACTFSTSELQKVVRDRQFLTLLTWKCASRHNGVHFFNISTAKSGPKLRCFAHFDLEMCFAPQGVQFFISHLASWLRTRRFSEPTFRPSGAPNHWKNRVFRDFPTFSRICIFFLLTLLSSTLLSSNLSLLSASSLLCFSSVHIVGSLTSKLPSTTTTTTSGSGSGSGSGGSRTSTSTSTSTCTCTCTCTSSTWRRGVGVTLIQTKQKRAAREQRNKYKPRTETRTTPSNQTRRQAGGFLQSSACSPEMPNCLFVKHGTCLPIPTATYRNYIIAIIYPFLGGD